MLKVKRVNAAIPAQDIKRARTFYEQKLGFKPAQETPDGGVVYVFGDTGFVLFPSMGKASGDHTQLGIDVDNVEAAANELRRAGVKLEDYDFPNFKTRDGIVDWPDGTKGAWFKDTEGNLLALGTLMPVASRT